MDDSQSDVDIKDRYNRYIYTQIDWYKSITLTSSVKHNFVKTWKNEVLSLQIETYLLVKSAEVE